MSTEAGMEQLSVADATDGPKETPEEKKARKEAEKAKKAEEKAKKEAEKVARQAQRGQKAAVITAPEAGDALGEHYGDSPLVQSRERTGTEWNRIEALTPDMEGQQVTVRARLHTSRKQGKPCFIVLRQRMFTVQGLLMPDDGVSVSATMVKYASQIPRESIVDVCGTVKKVDVPIDSCSQSSVELQVTDIHVVSRSAVLPFEIADAARSETEIAAAAAVGEAIGTVSQDTRLNMRHLDLRTPANQAIFRLQSAVCALFRESLSTQGFQEIHTPKLIGGSSEGGSNVFTLEYFDQSACLAQSPQLYKQMAICGDMEKVFEIGPVFRAEQSFTHRHMCEFTGLDFEMEIKEHYSEVMDTIEGLFTHMFANLQGKFATELGTVGEQFPFEPFVMKPMRFTFAEGIKMLQENGYPEADPLQDIGTEQEKALGVLMKAKYGTDFYILHKYPLSARPFYTMPCPDDPLLSNSFDVFMRGEEIISGAQRVHSSELLEERAIACEIPPESIRPYIDSFKLGAPPHGGCGVGMERVVMLYCALNNIRKTSMFPRDPKRLTP